MAQPVNLLIQDSNGQKQVIKVMPSAHGRPLTADGVKAIVKEVTGQEATRVITASQTSTSKIGQKMPVPQNSKLLTIPQSKGDPKQPVRILNFIQSSGHQGSGNGQSATTLTMSGGKTTHAITPMPTGSASFSRASNAGTPVPAGGVQVRRRKSDKLGKGLRHFSMKVCEKVKEKMITTYNEVADELVAEELDSSRSDPADPSSCDQKNIRRRVYDALNVLMAMNIISKEKKEIRWIGLPSNSTARCTNLELENQQRRKRIESKAQVLKELILLQVSFKSLVARNKEAEQRGLIPTPNSAIQLPFVVVNTHKETHINCSISHDKTEYFFKFDDKFEIHDHVKVLKQMGLLLGLDKGESTYEDIEKLKTMVPQQFWKYIESYGRGSDENMSDDWDMADGGRHNSYFSPKHELIDSADLDDDDMSEQSDGN
ncbi:transcription factor Dp [Lutzomyia longipalpis]|uniref:transcription factor Dp n=1 Tax=Lutzomyia longipalpis TaxID=7200 RepID=UPI0024840763|nr:transcription factor Dp [Lutzomyia longipalpis]